MPRLPHYYFEGQFSEYEEVIDTYATSAALYTPGDALTRLGHRIDTIFYIKSGIFKVVSLTDAGTEITCAFYGPGTLYPPKCQSFDFSIEGFMRFEAVTSVKALLIPVERNREMLLTHPEMALQAINSRTLELNLLTSRLVQNAVSAKYKVCNFLYLFYVDMNSPQLPLSQQDVASMTDTSRVQVARVYQMLRNEEIIESGHRSVKILAPEQLYQYCTRLLVP